MIAPIELEEGYYICDNTVSSTTDCELAFYSSRRQVQQEWSDFQGIVAKPDLRSAKTKVYDCRSCQVYNPPTGIVSVGSEFFLMEPYRGALVGESASSPLELKWWDKDASKQWSVQWVASVSEKA
jgi:hypothetical protein